MNRLEQLYKIYRNFAVQRGSLFGGWDQIYDIEYHLYGKGSPLISRTTDEWIESLEKSFKYFNIKLP